MIVTNGRKKKQKEIDLDTIKLNSEQIIDDYRIAFRSRQVSLMGKREVMGGKAKFGIFGDGKEVAQVALAKSFRKGDFRSGYYRDQTWMFALGISSEKEFFAQLYANPDLTADPATAGRQMICHFATRSLNDDGSWKKIVDEYNISADISPTGSQMPRLVGLAYASRLYRDLPALQAYTDFSNAGQEVAFGTIGNGSCAEGMFWEAVNAIGVLKTPVVLSIWDDDFGISVSNKYQVTKENISELLEGFRRAPGETSGYDIYRVKGWDYPELVKTYSQATRIAREEYVPAIIHVVELTQPQGHSTSGSQERYKTADRLQWEAEHDCIARMREWLIDENFTTAERLDAFQEKDAQFVVRMRDEAWEMFQTPIREEVQQVADAISEMAKESKHGQNLQQLCNRLMGLRNPARRNLPPAILDALITVKDEDLSAKRKLIEIKERLKGENETRFGSHLYSQSDHSSIKVPEVKPTYSAKSATVSGFELLNKCFDSALARDPRVIAFGEDVGLLGGVNQGFKNLQKKYGELRVSDTGIRECTIIGQAIGMAMRGLRPIADIQYLDYVLYALQIMSDDLATLHWRTRGGQKAPVVIRTRGHRLEGVWHSGSPMGGMVNLLRGMHLLVPRDMTQAAGFYNTMLQSDDPAIIIEVLNGYRIKERVPDNISEFTVPLGIPEILRTGSDVTIVTYGACCRLAMDAAVRLEKVGVDAEVIDVQSLLPFDLKNTILDSLKKTSRIVLLDEDVPGGGTAYMMQEVLQKQDGYHFLDSQPITISAKPHRAAFGSDGDYFSKPNPKHIFEGAYGLMHESDPRRYPIFY